MAVPPRPVDSFANAQATMTSTPRPTCMSMCSTQSVSTHRTKHRSGAPDDEARAAIVARLEPFIQQRVASTMASPAAQQRIQQRLLEERARLEAKVTAQIDAERQALLERRRQEQQQEQQQQQQQQEQEQEEAPLDLDRILEANRRKLEEARTRKGSGIVQNQVPTKKRP